MPKFSLYPGYSEIGDIPERVHEISLLDRIYKSRGVRSPSDLEYVFSNLHSPSMMKGIGDAADIIIEAIVKGKKLLVVSDYDCDGATSCCIAVEGMGLLGAKDVDFIVPNRFEYGYGLSPAIVEIAGQKNPDVIITVDNGISSIDGARAVKALSHPCRLVITDHHLAPSILPEADAIVNPNQPDCPFPSKSIAGCGVMFYVLLEIRSRMRDRGLFSELGIEEPNLAVLMDVLALGTVADVVPLDYNNRIFVSQGLRRINSGMVRPGIRALLEISKRRIGGIIASDFGFAVGPRLNAAGRLSDMSLGIKCLLEKDEKKAREMAVKLDVLNVERREIESQMKDGALDALFSKAKEYDDQFSLCLYDETWHEGVIGIVASRLKERFNRPVICFARSEDGLIKGSGRSVAKFHIRDALDAVATKNPGMLTKFGGHAMAAGMTILESDFERFRAAFDDEAKACLSLEDIEGCIETDGPIDPEDISMENAEALRSAGPWGQAFLEPKFEGEFEVLHQKVVGDNHLKFLLRPKDGSLPIDAVCFNCVEGSKAPTFDMIRAAFKMDINEYRGRRSLQLLIDYFESS